MWKKREDRVVYFIIAVIRYLDKKEIYRLMAASSMGKAPVGGGGGLS
jgi:hypothetical protein